ncbi:MAG: Ig-like domain-containing protein [Clostridia bacterium]|nr:Ig-like domain-containing protein [Clostridia bacterium]
MENTGFDRLFKILVLSGSSLIVILGIVGVLFLTSAQKNAVKDEVSHSDHISEPKEIVLSDSSVEVGKRLTYQLSVSGGKQIVFRSSDESVATVDENGLIKGNAIGNCTVTAENENGSTAECRVTVKKVVYITIDDGPTKYTDEILAVLKEYDAKVTFFVVGSYYLNLTKDMEEQGCVVGLHSDSHIFKQCYATNYSYFRGIEILSDKVMKYTGKRCKLLRFPGGTNTSRCEPLWMRRNLNGAADMGYRVFDWTATTADTSDYGSAAYSLKNVKKSCTEDEEIILMHDRWFSADTLRKIIPYLKDSGYLLETLDRYPDNCYYFTPIYSKTHKDLPSKSVKITHKTFQIYEGKDAFLTAEMNPVDSTDFVRWESSDTSIVTVDATGHIKALRQGQADITAITSSGHRGSCHVTVI